MTDERRKDIALLLEEQRCIDRGIPGADQFKRDMGNLLQRINNRTSGQKLNVSLEELMEFFLSLMPRVIGIVFDKRRVSLNTE